MNNSIPDKAKSEFVEKKYDKCKKIIFRSLKKRKYDKALAGISIASSLLYLWNQRYTDEFLEKSIAEVADSTMFDSLRELDCDNDAILFYDSFGLDVRGLALIYIKALARMNKKVFYVVSAKSEGKQPEIDKIINGSNIKKIYFESHDHYKKLRELQEILCQVKPSKAFLYTVPFDSAGVAAFMQLKSATRYLINLTDHAFWIGIHAFDYLLEFRNYGAFVSNNERGVEKSKILELPFYPIIDKETEFQGFPFATEGKKILFSGGALYKSIDKDKTYYLMVRRILEQNADCLFVYAGSGDDTYLKELMDLFPDRVFHIHERKDLYQVMKHITLYLNTYPLAGGLMTQYAAAAGKIPVLLWRGPEHSGILFDQESRKIEYKNVNELVDDVNRLLSDSELLHSREALLKGSVIEEEEFGNELTNIIYNSSSKYKIDYHPVDTLLIKKDYADRFKREDYWSYVAHIDNISWPGELIDAYINRAVMKMRRLLFNR